MKEKKWFISLMWIFSFSLLMFFSAQSAFAKPEGTLTILYTNLGGESADTVTFAGREEEAIQATLGEGLTNRFYDPVKNKRGFHPAIAKSWETSPDLKTWKFTIRKDVKFHDGTPVTLDDVLYTWDRVLNSPLSKATSAKRIVASVTSEGDDTVVFNLKAPNAFFMWRSACYMIQPKAYIEKIGEEKFAQQPVYAGPWKFKKQAAGDYLEVEAFEGHYRKTPYYKKLVLRIVPETSTQLAMMKTGEADLIYRVPIGPALFEAKKARDLKLIELPSMAESFAYFANLSKKDNPPTPFRDKRVRHAIAMAIDRQLLIDKVYHSYGTPSSTTCIIPGSPQWHPDAKPIAYDPEKAKALLAEAGYPDGFDIPFISTAREKTEVEAIASMLTKIGIRPKIQMMETGALLAAVRKKTLPDSIRISYHTSTPGGMWYYFRKNQLYTIMNDDKLDELTKKMGSIPEGPEMDAFVKNQMCMYVYDLMPSIPIVCTVKLFAAGKKVDTTEWEKMGCTSLNFGPMAEYLKTKK